MGPTYRLRAGGTISFANATLVAVDGDIETPVDPDEPGEHREAAGKLFALGLVSDGAGTFVSPLTDDNVAPRFWTDGLAELPEEWEFFVPENLVDVRVRKKPLGSFAKVTSGRDWLKIKLRYESDGVAADPEELRRALLEGQRYVRLTDGSFASLAAETMKRILARDAELANLERDDKLPIAQAWRVEELLKLASASVVSPQAKDLLHKLANMNALETVRQPKGLKASLRPYQEAGLSWMKFVYDIGSGGVLADDMGLGKVAGLTSSILAEGGWRQFGTIRVGDRVIGSSGKPTRVLGVYPQGRPQLFRVTLSDGSSTRCGGPHLWRVQSRDGSGGQVLTLDEIVARGLVDARGERFYIPKLSPMGGYGLAFAIANVEPAGEEESQCIRVEADDGLYVTDDYILTHNTIQTISLFLIINQFGQGKRSLVVAPTSLVTSWNREIDKFAPSLRSFMWHGANRDEAAAKKADVLLTSYALLRRDEEFLASLDFDLAVLDEAQYIKNPKSAATLAAKRLKAKHRLALTGTPVENRLDDLWSIFDFATPGLLGSRDAFNQLFSKPIECGDTDTSARLRKTIYPFILRRMKTDVAKDLPEKIEQDHVCELAGKQVEIYRQIALEVRAKVMGDIEKKGVDKSQSTILAGLTRLRQAACDPRLLGLPRNDFGDDDSGKLLALRELVTSAVDGGHRVLIFSQFVEMLKLIKNVLAKDKITYTYLDGSTPDRGELVKKFQEDASINTFLISLKAGGSGLTLTAADTVIHFDPWWNPAVENQATDRAYRIGQKRVVTAYKLRAAGTIEEKILILKGKKGDLAASVLTEDAGGVKHLTKSDLESLFAVD